jgi:hypothetical protein
MEAFSHDQLAALRSAPKFQREGLYPHAPTEEMRKSAELAIDKMLDRKPYVLSEFLEMLKAFESDDMEERLPLWTLLVAVPLSMSSNANDSAANSKSSLSISETVDNRELTVPVAHATVVC